MARMMIWRLMRARSVGVGVDAYVEGDDNEVDVYVVADSQYDERGAIFNMFIM